MNNLTPVSMPTNWVLLIGMVIVALIIAGLIWWHRTHPAQAIKDLIAAKDELRGMFGALKAQLPAPVTTVPLPDPLFYNGIKFPTPEALSNYKMAQATLAQYPPLPKP